MRFPDTHRLLMALSVLSSPLIGPTDALSEPRLVTLPIHCSRGPSGQAFRATVTTPSAETQGKRFKVRIDSFSSGKISHFGLKYLFDMSTHYAVGAGARFVEGSLTVVPNTGSSNVRPSARAWHDATGIHLLLPARVPNGGSYTPPSLEFELAMSAPPGKEALLEFRGSRFSVNAFLVGTLHTTCAPAATPAVIARTRSLAAAPPEVQD